MSFPCASCDDAIEYPPFDEERRHCKQCYLEIKHGIITPTPDVLLLDEELDLIDDDPDDDAVGYWENGIRTMEDRLSEDMP